jgi:SAM-dependent methyltransferase
MDYLYRGLPGYFQRRGHKVIHSWSKEFKDKRVLEIGCGHGHHLVFGGIYENYFGLDISYDFLTTARNRHKKRIAPIQGDALNLPFEAKSLDAVVSVYMLEHVNRLDEALWEVKRVLKPGGAFLVAVPCEGGFFYNAGREFTSKPYMVKKYGIDYDAIIKAEHCNEIWDILSALETHFRTERSMWIPLYLPLYHLNIVSCFECRLKQ